MDLGIEVFALRDGETIQAFDDWQPDAGLCIAVMARSVEMPDGPKQATRTKDGAPIEKAAILAATKGVVSGAWQWLQLAPETKEAIGDYLFDEVKAKKDRWYYLTVFRATPPAESEAPQ